MRLLRSASSAFALLVMLASALHAQSGVTVTGTTSGTVTAAVCIRFGGNARFTLRVKVTDASGKMSNVLTLEVPNPGGVPLGTRGSDGAPGMTLEPQ